MLGKAYVEGTFRPEALLCGICCTFALQMAGSLWKGEAIDSSFSRNTTMPATSSSTIHPIKNSQVEAIR